jgi:hypothetical protein
MLGRVAVVVIASLVAAPALPQCSYSLVRSAQFRSSALDLSLDGIDLWVATSYGLSLYDRSFDPPKLLASVAVPGTTRLVRAQNGTAYAGSGSSLVIVQRTGPHSLAIVRTIETGATINDMIVTTLDLYVASTNGIGQYDLLNPTNPSKTNATFTTSRTAVTSLALIGAAMYAADGDSSIEAFDLSVRGIPRLIGSVTAPGGINFVRANNAKLYASSGLLSTYVFSGTGASMTNVGSGAFGTASLAPVGGDVAFMAASDRRLRGVDFSTTAAPVEVFRSDLPPTGGTINRISSMATTNKRLYVAAGDSGLLTYDITNFASPFPVRAYSTGGGTSVFFLTTNVADRVYIGRDSGGITEFTQSSNGGLTQARSWDGSRSDVVWDGNNGLLLTSSGASMTMWTVQSATPQVVSTTTFAAPISSAVLSGTTAWAVLNNGTVWSADMALAAPQPRSTAITVPVVYINRSGSALLLTTATEAGTTTVSYYATGDLTQTPKTTTVAGIAATRPAFAGSTAAVLTFSGITIIDAANGTARTLPRSTGLARGLLLNGTTLYELTDTSLIVWDTQTQTATNEFVMPADPIAMHAGPSSSIVDVVTSTGVATVVTTAASKLPASIATPNPNAYYRRVAANSNFLYLFDGRNADIYTPLLRYITSLRSITDMTADANGVYTITSSLLVNSYTADAAYLRGLQLIDAQTARSVAMRAVGGAVWVSIESGCPTCVQTTYVFDPRNGMSQTASFSGGVVDVVTSGTRAYVLTDFPSEVRVMNISDPFHPSPVITAPAPQSPVSIAYANGTVYVLGDKLTAYAESTLTRLADILGSYAADPTGLITPADQRVRIEGNCAIVTGRSFSPQLYTVAAPTAWTTVATPPVPSPVRSIATLPGVIQLLTDHSLETWSTTPLPKPPRREPAR